MTLDPSPDEDLTRQAAECFLCLEKDGIDREAVRRWRAWLSESPAHRQAYELCRKIWKNGRPGDMPWPDAAELTQDSYDGDQRIPLPHEAGDSGMLHAPRGPASVSAALAGHEAVRLAARPRQRGWQAPLRIAAVLTSLVITAVLALRWHSATDPLVRAFATERGERRQLTLPDGSTVLLGPQSSIEVKLSSTQRTLRLRSGEAIFTVAHDARRPFRVFAGSGLVQDIGTAFNVRVEPATVTVTVLQGSVDVSASPSMGASNAEAADPRAPVMHLTRDQQISYGEALGVVQTVDGGSVTGWRDGRLTFIERPLSEVVRELRRHTLRNIVIRDRSTEALDYTGTVAVEQISQWARGLALVYPIRVETDGNELILSAK